MSHVCRTIPALAATALMLASCGGGAQDPTATTSAADREAARIRFQQCLRQNGVDVAPTTSQGGGASGPSTRTEGDSDKMREAVRACDKYRKDAFGELTPEQRQEFQDAFAKFSSCMRKEGVEVPAPPAAGGGSGGRGAIVRQRIEASPKARAAMEACRENLPQGSEQGGGRILVGPGPGAGSAEAGQ